MAKLITASEKHLDLLVKEISESELGQVYFENKKFDQYLKLAIEKNEVVLLMEKETFIGMMWFSLQGTFNKYPYLHMLLVNPKYRHKGVATKLLNYFEKKITSAYQKVFLMVGDYNTAKAMYEALGYVEVGVLENFYINGVHEYLMMKDKSVTSKETYKNEKVASKNMSGLRGEKIGELVKRTLPYVTFTEALVDELTSQVGSKNLLGLDMPVLRKYDESLTEKENRMMKDIPAYYGKPYVYIGEDKYLIASTWEPSQKDAYQSWLESIGFVDIDALAKKAWDRVVEKINKGHTELQTLNRFEDWFTVSHKGETIFVNKSHQKPTVRIDDTVMLYMKKFIEVYPLYLRREKGEDVSEEATKLTVDQVYFFSIMKNLSE